MCDSRKTLSDGQYFGPSIQLASVLAPVFGVAVPTTREVHDVTYGEGKDLLADNERPSAFTQHSQFVPGLIDRARGTIGDHVRPSRGSGFAVVGNKLGHRRGIERSPTTPDLGRPVLGDDVPAHLETSRTRTSSTLPSLIGSAPTTAPTLSAWSGSTSSRSRRHLPFHAKHPHPPRLTERRWLGQTTPDGTLDDQAKPVEPGSPKPDSTSIRRLAVPQIASPRANRTPKALLCVQACRGRERSCRVQAHGQIGTTRARSPPVSNG